MPNSRRAIYSVRLGSGTHWDIAPLPNAPSIPGNSTPPTPTSTSATSPPLLAGASISKPGALPPICPSIVFNGLIGLVDIVTWGALLLLGIVLLSGLLGIGVTLYTEVDAEAREIGLLKALGASNLSIGMVFLGKGALIGMIGVVLGIPLARAIGGQANRLISDAVVRTAGLSGIEQGLFRQDPSMVLIVGAGVLVLSALAALMPALQAAAKDPQEALRAE